MNEERRKRIGKAISLIEDARSLIDDCSTEEREALENIPDKESDKAVAMEEAATALEDASSTCDTVIMHLEEARAL